MQKTSSMEDWAKGLRVRLFNGGNMSDWRLTEGDHRSEENEGMELN